MTHLFVCERQYPMYRTLLRCVGEPGVHDVVISEQVPGMARLVEPLRASGIFRNVYLLEDDPYQDFDRLEVSNREGFGKRSLWRRVVDQYLPELRKLVGFFVLQRRARRMSLPAGLDVAGYERIYVNDCASSISLHLFSRRQHVVWVEHGLNAFAVGYREPFADVLQVLERLRLSYALRGRSRFVDVVEVSSRDGLHPALAGKQISVVPLDDLRAALTPAQGQTILDVYARAFGLDLDYSHRWNLLLTVPLAREYYARTLDEQERVYRRLVTETIGDDAPLLVKPHPRDKLDYATVFPEAVIIPQQISAEVLALSDTLHLDCVFTIISSSITAFDKADRRVTVGTDFVRDIVEEIAR